MLKSIFIGILLLSITALPNIVMSQDGPMGKWWLNPRMSEQLKLTDEEINKLNEQYVESHRKMIDLKNNVKKERFELSNLLDSEPLDEGAVKAQFKKLEKARSSLSSERIDNLITSRKILGKKRFQQVKQMFKNKRKNRKSHK